MNSPDQAIINETEAKPTPTFGRTVENVQKLAVADSCVAGLLGVFGKEKDACSFGSR